MLAELNYGAALPEIVILAAASLILLIDLFLPDDRRHVSYWLTQLALLLAACVTLTTLRLDSIKGYHGLIVDDMLADFLRIACFVSVSLMLFYSRPYLVARKLFRGEVFVLTLFALLELRPRVPVQLMADVIVAFIDGLAIHASLAPEANHRVAFDVLWLSLLSLAE